MPSMKNALNSPLTLKNPVRPLEKKRKTSAGQTPAVQTGSGTLNARHSRGRETLQLASRFSDTVTVVIQDNSRHYYAACNDALGRFLSPNLRQAGPQDRDDKHAEE